MMNADQTQQDGGTPAGWMHFALVAFAVGGGAGVAIDLNLDRLLPYRWGPHANTPMQMLRGEQLTIAQQQLATTERSGAMALFATLGGLLALSFGLVDALRVKNSTAFLLLPVGVALAAGAGAGAGCLGTYLYSRSVAASITGTPAITDGIIVQTAAWSCLGLGVAIAVWLASARRRPIVETLGAGVFAGVLVGAIYPLVASLAFPDENTDRLFPSRGFFPAFEAEGRTGAFLFWIAFNSVMFGALLGAVKRLTASPKAPQPETASPSE